MRKNHPTNRVRFGLFRRGAGALASEGHRKPPKAVPAKAEGKRPAPESGNADMATLRSQIYRTREKGECRVGVIAADNPACLKIEFLTDLAILE